MRRIRPVQSASVLALGASLLFGMTACGGDEGSELAADSSMPSGETTAGAADVPTTPQDSLIARETRKVKSLKEFSELSEVVVLGTVVAVERGRSVGDMRPQAGGIEFRAVTLKVEEVLKGDAPASLIIEETGFKDGIPVTINDASYANVGDKLIVGLRKKDSEVDRTADAYVQVSTQTRFFVNADGSVKGPYRAGSRNAGQDPFTRENAAKRSDVIIKELRAAA